MLQIPRRYSGLDMVKMVAGSFEKKLGKRIVCYISKWKNTERQRHSRLFKGDLRRLSLSPHSSSPTLLKGFLRSHTKPQRAWEKKRGVKTVFHCQHPLHRSFSFLPSSFLWDFREYPFGIWRTFLPFSSSRFHPAHEPCYPVLPCTEKQ